MVLLSNLVSNVPAVILWLPVVPRLPRPEWIWLVMAMSSTFAGNLTLLGSMANLIVAERAQSRGVTLGFGEYLRAGLPVTTVGARPPATSTAAPTSLIRMTNLPSASSAVYQAKMPELPRRDSVLGASDPSETVP